ncbi:MAG: FkbM family methyltransferase [Simkaniaceae bacterium]|nr:FkbM family methyltransferase [Candidatus Sacchlamyda saccharinae]
MKRFYLLVFVFIQQLCLANYFSQCGQDKYVYEHFFRNVRKGVFVDIGAHDGITYSNTYFLEKSLGWSGICIEPMQNRFDELQKARDCTCIQGCIAETTGMRQFLLVTSPYVNTEMLSGLIDMYDPRHLERVDIEINRYGGSYDTIDVPCYVLNDLLEENGITHVNFLSIDTEGGEFEILSSIDFSKYSIDVIAVEDNYKDPRFIPFLEERGFQYITDLAQDLIFVHRNFKAGKKRFTGYQ